MVNEQSNINTSQYTILVVDDVPVNIQVVEMLLIQHNFKFIKAADGMEALQKVADARPDLILLDVMMPEMDGFEVLTRLKNDAKTRNIPVIMMTALNSEADVNKGFSLGASDFVVKPIIKERLESAIMTQLKQLGSRDMAAGQSSGESKGSIPQGDLLRYKSYLFCSRNTPVVNVMRSLSVCFPPSMLDGSLFDQMKAPDGTPKDSSIVKYDLLAWAMKKIQEWTPESEMVDASAILRQTVDCMQAVSAERNLSWNVSIPDGVQIRTSAELFGNILFTLAVCVCQTGSDCEYDVRMEDGGRLSVFFAGGNAAAGMSETFVNVDFCLMVAKEMAGKLGGALTIERAGGTGLSFRLEMPK